MERRIFGIENEYGVTCTFDGPAPADARRGRALPLPQGRRRGAARATSSSPTAPGSTSTSAPPRVRHARVRRRAPARHPRQGGGADPRGPGRRRPAAAAPTRASRARSTSSRTTPTRPATPTAATRTTSSAGRGEFQQLSDVLIPFLVSRQIICGAGKVVATARGATYCVSQRADHIWEGVSCATTRSRPIINTRDEPHADAEKYRRLHVIVGDSNMSETTDHAQGRLGRPGAADDRGRRRHARPHAGEPDPGDPRDQPRHDRPARRSGWPTAASCRRWRSSASTSSRRGDVRRPRGPGRPRCTSRCSTCGSARSTPSSSRRPRARSTPRSTGSSSTGSSSATRPSTTCRWTSPRIAQLDLAYHDINRRRGLFYLLQRHGRAARVTTDLEIFEAKIAARRRRPGPSCAATSSGPRRSTGRDFTVDWVHLKLNDQAQRTVLCKDPFARRRRAGRAADREHVTARRHAYAASGWPPQRSTPQGRG